MLSDLKKRKLRARFAAIDVDKNGVIERADYLLMRDNFARVGGLEKDSQEYLVLDKQVNVLWELLRQSADVNQDDKVTEEEFLAYMETQLEGDDFVQKQILPFVHFNFKLLDPDKTGRLTKDIFLVGAECLCMDKTTAETSFERLDVDGKGYIEMEEYTARAKEFYLEESLDAPGNWMFGEF